MPGLFYASPVLTINEWYSGVANYILVENC